MYILFKVHILVLYKVRGPLFKFVELYFHLKQCYLIHMLYTYSERLSFYLYMQAKNISKCITPTTYKRQILLITRSLDGVYGVISPVEDPYFPEPQGEGKYGSSTGDITPYTPSKERVTNLLSR